MNDLGAWKAAQDTFNKYGGDVFDAWWWYRV
jgi:hypothetical protein